MRELPSGWNWITLGELAEVQGGITKGNKRRSDEAVRPVPYLRVANVQRGFLDLSEMKEIEASESQITRLNLLPGDVLFNEGGDRDKLGRGWVWSGELPECIHQNHVFRARLRPGLMEPKFLSYYGNSEAQHYFESEGKQTTNLASISLTKLVALPVIVPPCPEQRRIVAKLEELFSELDAGVEALRRAQRRLARYRQSLLQAAVTGELTWKWRESRCVHTTSAHSLLDDICELHRKEWVSLRRVKLAQQGKRVSENQEITSFSTPEEPTVPDSAPQLPAKWTWASPAQLTAPMKHSLVIGPFGSDLKVSDYRDKGIPLIFVRNIRSGIFTGDGAKYVSQEKALQLRNHTARTGDILITKMGDPPGDACMYPEESPDAIITADCIKLTPSPMLKFPAYLVAAINSDTVRKQIGTIARGVAQQKVSLERFRAIAIPLPPTEEQEVILSELDRRFSAADALEATLQASLRRAERLRKSSLERAFRGELVSQDPSDEPAETLLGRLRAVPVEAPASRHRGRPQKAKAKALALHPPDDAGVRGSR